MIHIEIIIALFNYAGSDIEILMDLKENRFKNIIVAACKTVGETWKLKIRGI